ncbi:MAG: copper resistance CopC family protein [Methylocystis sp.]|jgi:hypothetical protein
MRPPLTFAAALLALAAAQVPAAAHVYLVDSTPAKRQEIMHPLNRVRLLFSGKADALFSTIKLADASGAVMAQATQNRASREMVLEAPALRPGTYRVFYRVLSTDGDIVEGQVKFAVVGDATRT